MSRHESDLYENEEFSALYERVEELSYKLERIERELSKEQTRMDRVLKYLYDTQEGMPNWRFLDLLNIIKPEEENE